MDFIALTASLMLLGAMYIGTNHDSADEPQVGYSEEVFCPQMRKRACRWSRCVRSDDRQKAIPSASKR